MIIDIFFKYAETMKVVFTIAAIITLCAQILKSKNINQ